MRVQYRLKHYDGDTHAEFLTANAAFACQRGLAADPDARVRTWFHFENEDGERVELRDRTRNPGHAYAILDLIKP